MTENTPDAERLTKALQSIQLACDYHLDWQEVPNIVTKIKDVCKEALCPTKQ